ncbi:MAG: RNA polymerase sigma factor [Candidatus Binataceae bacterium]
MTRGDRKPQPHDAILEDVFRREAARIVATLVRILGDIELAEEVLQETLVVALEQWRTSGIPANPAAWLTAVGRNRAIDHLRRAKNFRSKSEELAREQAILESETEMDNDGAAAIPDDRLRLIFICCHPALPAENRVALTLRLVGGLTTAEIARAFLVPEATVAQRIVRAKRIIRDRRIPYAIPERIEMASRTASVLTVIYLIFNEGYTAGSGVSLTRVDLCAEAIRLGLLLIELMPDESEAAALLALMELQASRNRARVGKDGELVLLAEQDRSLWDRQLITSGLDHLERARGTPSAYQLQAEIAACYATASTMAETDWNRIAALFADLSRVAPSPVVELNRAVAVSRAEGPAPALALLEAIRDAPALREYHLLPATRADFLRRLNRWPEAAAEYRRALDLVQNDRERAFLLGRLSECESH